MAPGASKHPQPLVVTMRLVMAVSKDGFVARGEHDNMAWTGSTDKAVFKLLTSLDGGIIAVGKKTAALMPELKGRCSLVLSRGGHTLADVANEYPGATLVGGQTVALAALEQGFVSDAILVHSDRFVFGGIRDKLTPWLAAQSFTLSETKILDVVVRMYRLKPRNYGKNEQFRLEP